MFLRAANARAARGSAIFPPVANLRSRRQDDIRVGSKSPAA
ncbi:hypothetical protein B0G75_11872 [Paraburkholderia sp. BL18I3N2]|nr:hypothetical protein B0G75_11872 [Paraburkholderia sp. BL18I3N2]